MHVSFNKSTINYKALLRKMTNKDKASFVSSPPCILRASGAILGAILFAIFVFGGAMLPATNNKHSRDVVTPQYRCCAPLVRPYREFLSCFLSSFPLCRDGPGIFLHTRPREAF